ncbi:3-hydroxybutyrate oligomer hydrolase family protein [Usitatibacter palustris]|uniref:D-(-)-3-hydroxybutyrate oligomer hydrolase n=1 Tax=Usitatibacter palustris TaxID=2732487 RepID=A0A6M4HDI2_9PROT|nr:3-hydroxybutyrate oligomer hydrolase family protein [Usitatibacter palustris]QJR16563.1 D-(-)-3-hydroxybutyrate oligomer hydrolase [Usitatibacter palustris]
MKAKISLGLIALAAAGCGGGGSTTELPLGTPESVPGFVKGAITRTAYDGVSDDLLTAGLGKTGLAGAAPTFVDGANPTAAELRRSAIYNNYRALIDITANGGYGTLYGPNVDAAGVVTTSEGRIAGEEHIAYADDGSGSNVTMVVQIPSTFNVGQPCIITASSSGSRGVYGAIATAGEWGLKRGCAVAYTDKGTGNGAHDLAANAVYSQRGVRATVASPDQSNFTAPGTDAERTGFLATNPNRWAYKHAHSQRNPESTWGRDTLQAIEFAFYVLNQKYGTPTNGNIYATITKGNTIVIASSVSNGGGAALAAAELDDSGWIDGVAVAEPQVQMNLPTSITIRRGTTPVAAAGKPLYDYFTIADLYQPCAAYSAAAASSPGLAFVPAAIATNRCAALAAKGLVTGATLAEQSNDALAKLFAAGWEPESTLFHATHYALATLSVTLTYANAYSRASYRDNLCGYSFGGTPAAGTPAPLAANAAAQLFGTGNGVPPTSGINILNNNSVGGVAVDAASVSPSTGAADFNIDGATCLRDLFTGTGTQAIATRAGIDATKRTGILRGKPAVIVHGRSDTLIPVNHSSRPYYAMHRANDAEPRLAYYEVTNAQHFDGFLGNALLAGYDTRLVPLHRYFNQAMDIVWNNLKNGTAIPPSQVVRTTPRGGTPGAAPAITAANVPPIATAPPLADQIIYLSGTLTVPD